MRFRSAQGKVRDTYVVGDKLVIVTTDRQSAFDRLLASIPFKVLPNTPQDVLLFMLCLAHLRL